MKGTETTPSGSSVQYAWAGGACAISTNWIFSPGFGFFASVHVPDLRGSGFYSEYPENSGVREKQKLCVHCHPLFFSKENGFTQ